MNQDEWHYRDAIPEEIKDPDMLDRITMFFSNLSKVIDRIKPERKRYLIEVIQIEETQHNHYKFKSQELFTTLTLTTEGKPNQKVEVEPKDLYEVPVGIKGFLVFLWTGQAKHYMMIVNDTGKPIPETKAEIKGKVLKVARDWKGLGKAIKDSFGSRVEIPRIALIALVFVAIAIMAYLVAKGHIPLPRSWTQ